MFLAHFDWVAKGPYKQTKKHNKNKRIQFHLICHIICGLFNVGKTKKENVLPPLTPCHVLTDIWFPEHLARDPGISLE